MAMILLLYAILLFGSIVPLTKIIMHCISSFLNSSLIIYNFTHTSKELNNMLACMLFYQIKGTDIQLEFQRQGVDLVEFKVEGCIYLGVMLETQNFQKRSKMEIMRQINEQSDRRFTYQDVYLASFEVSALAYHVVSCALHIIIVTITIRPCSIYLGSAL